MELISILSLFSKQMLLQPNYKRSTVWIFALPALVVLFFVGCNSTAQSETGNQQDGGQADPTGSLKVLIYRTTHFRGFMSPQVFNEADFAALAHEYHANLLRWQLDAIGDWKVKLENDKDLAHYNEWLDFKLNELDRVLKAAAKYRIKVVVDLHYPPGGHYDDDHSLVMFYEKKYNDRFIELWKTIANRYKGNTAVWGYDLINEPVQNKPAQQGLDYLQTQLHAAQVIRAIDADVPVIVESGDWARAGDYASMPALPIKNLIYEAHMYEPQKFTAQGVLNHFTDVHYPGFIDGKAYDKAALKEILQPLRNFQLAHNAHIYIGEFSAVRWAPGAAQYLNDCIQIFEEYGWDWTYHAFREADVWSVEHENIPADQPKEKVVLARVNTDRKNVLLKWFKLNGK